MCEDPWRENYLLLTLYHSVLYTNGSSVYYLLYNIIIDANCHIYIYTNVDWYEEVKESVSFVIVLTVD